MKNRKQEMTSLEKVVLIAICLAIFTYLLRMWDPAFFRWFHMVPMQEVSFLRNVWQTVWLTFQIIVYIVWIVSVLWMAAILICGIISLIIGAITGTIDVLLAVWNLITWVIPAPRAEMEMSITRSVFNRIGNIGGGRVNNLMDNFPTSLFSLVISTIIALLLLMPLFGSD